MRLVLVEDVLATLGDPDHALLVFVPDLPELGALALVGAADLLGVAVDLVVGVLVAIAAEFVEALARCRARQVLAAATQVTSRHDRLSE